MQYTETELSDLIKSVEAEFSAHLALAKSEDAPPKEEESKDEPKGEAEGEGESHEEQEKPGQEDESPEAEEEQPEAEESEEIPQEEESQDEPSEGHDYDDEDMQQMHEMYSSMSRGELIAHHDAIKQCLDAQKGGEEMAKSETAAIEIPEVKSEEIALLKNEVEAEKAKATELKKSLDMVTELLTKMVQKTAPKAKAVTELQVINKSEMPGFDAKALSKIEITAKLSAAASRPDLAKSDREAINAYYLTNNPNIESISHLLK